MLIACWSVKGGVGTTVSSIGVALAAAARPSVGAVLLVDLAGDLPLCLGLAEPAGPGLAAWLEAGPDAPPDALARLQVPVWPGLAVLPRGEGPLSCARSGVLVQLLSRPGRTVVVDCGQLTQPGLAQEVAAAADRSLLVSRLCMLGLRRAIQAPVRPSGVIVVREPGRSLDLGDVEATVGAPVVAEVALDPSVARLVDVGLLRGRLPRSFAGALGAVAA